MNTFILTVALLTLFASALVAAWPLLFLPRLRPALARVGGTGCITLGSAIMALLTSGLLQLPGSAAQAYAEDKASAPAKAEAENFDPIIESTDTIEIPPGRPQWIGAEPNFRGKIHTIPVASGPYANDKDAKQALNEALVKAANKYIADELGSELAPTFIRFDSRTLLKDYVKEENRYHDTARYSVGFMHEHFALLEFDTKFRNELDRRWDKVRAGKRLAQTGLVSGAALLLLASVFGYFRLDNATRGYYTGRLQFMTAAAILAVVGVAAVVATRLPWL
jgi:hypothetical protein